MLVLFARPPEELDVRYEGVKRHVPPPAGSVLLLPAGSPARVRSGGHKDELHVFLEPGVVGRVGAKAFGLDPARLAVPPIDGLDLPHLRAAMWAVDAELTSGGAGGKLAAESLANVLAVHLIRHVLAPRRGQVGPRLQELPGPLDAAQDHVLVGRQPGGLPELPREVVGTEAGHRRHLLQARAGVEVLLDVLDHGAEPSAR